jgi:hypothetical protein
MKKNSLFVFIILLLSTTVFSQSVDRSKKELNSNNGSKNKSSKSTSSSSISDYDPETIWLIFRFLGYASYGVLIGDYVNEEHL